MRGGANRLYSIFFRSVWQIPQVSTRITSSPQPACGVSTDSTPIFPSPRYTAARIVAGIASFNRGSFLRNSATDKKISQDTRSLFGAPLQAEQSRENSRMRKCVTTNLPTREPPFDSTHFV